MNHKYIWIAKEITSFLETYAIVMVCAPPLIFLVSYWIQILSCLKIAFYWYKYKRFLLVHMCISKLQINCFSCYSFSLTFSIA